MNIVFFGTPDFAVIMLQKLINASMKPVAVVTAPDKPADRGHRLQSPPVKLCAEDHHIPVLQPDKLDSGFIHQLADEISPPKADPPRTESFKPDVFVIAAYGKILPKTLLDIPPKGTINVHPSLLPRHRGPSPIQTAILEGDEITGVTLMCTDEKMDHGPIISNVKFQMSNLRITYTELHDKLAKLGGDLLVETLPQWIKGEITSQEQDHQKATYTKLLSKEDGHIDWKKSATEIDRMVRALNPWPGTWNYINSRDGTSEQKRVKILSGHPSEEPSLAPPGSLIKTKNGSIAVCTGDNLYIIETLQVEGGNKMNGQRFYEKNSGSSSFFC
ncbi:MAG: methionyl-tRNA formyltransferase [Parcubacteria group bacterium Gr01-1014_70]|nr:MAG: methionyl-tRNA formyltransferase [Parcubacteria group bacterium Gr01-1014_70]